MLISDKFGHRLKFEYRLKSIRKFKKLPSAWKRRRSFDGKRESSKKKGFGGGSSPAGRFGVGAVGAVGAAGPGRSALRPAALADVALRLLGQSAAGCGRPVPGLPAGPAQPAPACSGLSRAGRFGRGPGPPWLKLTVTGGCRLCRMISMARLFPPHGRVGVGSGMGLGFGFSSVSTHTQRRG